MAEFLINALLDAVFNNGSFAVAVPWISLHIADPGTNGADEVVGGSYGREDASATFSAAASGAITTDVAIDFPLMPACTVTYMGVWDAESAGNFLWGGVLAAQKTVNAGDTFRFPIGDIDGSLT